MLKKITITAALALLLLVAAAPSQAATVTGTATVSAANVTRGLAALARINQQTCVSLGLPKTCTDLDAKGKDPKAQIYADANAYASAQVQKIVDSLLSSADEYDKQDVVERYRISTPGATGRSGGPARTAPVGPRSTPLHPTGGIECDDSSFWP